MRLHHTPQPLCLTLAALVLSILLACVGCSDTSSTDPLEDAVADMDATSDADAFTNDLLPDAQDNECDEDVQSGVRSWQSVRADHEHVHSSVV